MRTITTLIAAAVLFSATAAHAQPAYQKVKELADIYGQFQSKALTQEQAFEKIYNTSFCRTMSFVPVYEANFFKRSIKNAITKEEQDKFETAFMQVKIDFVKATGVLPNNPEFDNELRDASDFCNMVAVDYLIKKK